jgi:hypothetical protein
MTRRPKIPMTPDAQPAQTLNLVVDLPPRPAGFTFEIGHYCSPEGGGRIRSTPRAPVFLAQIEWAETPMNNGIYDIYIEGRRRHWVLWSRWYDDGGRTARWHWTSIGYCARAGVARDVAAIHLLEEFWRADGTAPGDSDHWINEKGALSVETLRAIARAACAPRRDG